MVRIAITLQKWEEFRQKLHPSDKEPVSSGWQEWGAFLCTFQPQHHLMWIHA